jgi:6-phosphogluconolactonase (cycloisomerase 2 family)
MSMMQRLSAAALLACAVQGAFAGTETFNSQTQASLLTPSPSVTHYAYVANSSDSTLSMYSENPTTGALTPLAGSPMATIASPRYVTSAPSGTGAYVYVAGSGGIAMYVISADGTLGSPIGSRLSTNLASALQFGPSGQPSGQFAYAIDSNGLKQIDIFLQNSDGTLTAGTPVPVDVNAMTALTVDLAGGYLYVLAAATVTNDAIIIGFTINADGTLTQLSGNPATMPGNNGGLAVDPSGHYLYATDASSSTIALFTIGADGALTLTQQVSTAPYYSLVGGFTQSAVLVDPAGQHLLLTGRTTAAIGPLVLGEVLVYSIGAGGTLTLSNLSATRSLPATVALDPTANHLYVSNTGTTPTGTNGDTLSAYTYSNGKSAPLTPFTVTTGNGPRGIAFY